MGNSHGTSSTRSNKSAFDPANCECRKTEFKLKCCSCGRSKPSNEPPVKIRFMIDSEKIRKGIPYNSLDLPEHAKRDLDRDPDYQALVRELQGYANQISKQTKYQK